VWLLLLLFGNSRVIFLLKLAVGPWFGPVDVSAISHFKAFASGRQNKGKKGRSKGTGKARAIQ
jgi:hypothetical protein